MQTATPAITAGERARRQRSVDAAAHSSALEGLRSDDAHRADTADFVNGLITRDQLIQRGLERYVRA